MDESERLRLYKRLKFLITDDFENFRKSLRQMLRSFGAEKIDMAANGHETVTKCTYDHFDILLCDYNLGPGKTGQQILETLRHKKLLRHTSLFVIITAETSREIVMSAREYHPDTYIIKPITQAVLQKRMDALLDQRQALLPINEARDREEPEEAIKAGEELLHTQPRYRSQILRLLGDLYYQNADNGNARRIFEESLQKRELAWARLGVGKVALAESALDEAIGHFETLIESTPDFIEAYDYLAEAWKRKGKGRKAQEMVEKALEISPMALLRQRNLAEIATENQDMETAADAWRSTVKLSDNSVHESPEIYLGLSRCLSDLSDGDTSSEGKQLADEALNVLSNMGKRFKEDENAQIQKQLVGSRIYAGQGRTNEARKALASVQDQLDPEQMTPDQALDYAKTLYSQNDPGAAQQVLNKLAERYEDDEEVMQAIEELMDEPVSFRKKNKARSLNREGIAAFEDGRLQEAADAFNKALELVPQHPALNLNLVQVLLKGQEKEGPSEAVLKRCQRCLDQLGHLPPQHRQYKRYQFLCKKVSELLQQS